MASSCSLHLHTLSPQHRMFINGVGIEFGIQFSQLKYNRHRNHHKQLVLTACSSDSRVSTQSISDDSVFTPQNLKKSLEKFQRICVSTPPIIAVKSQDTFRQAVGSIPPVVVVIKRQSGVNLILGFCLGIACLVIAIRIYVARKLSNKRPGSVADLVRRGQLRSDRRENEREIHQKRRSRAYQWKRPKVFLKEGDSVPPDVDPESVRWIPTNHSFATTTSDLDEDLAQTNVYQKHGVPFRIQAEHEALQRKLEALQSEQKLDKLVIDPINAKDFERAFKTQSKSIERPEGPQNGQVSDPKSPKSKQVPERPETLDDNANST